MSDRIRRQILYSGRVQGVGFRYTATAVSRDYPVAGYVKNLSDARVEVVAEGEPSELDRFQAALEEKMRCYVQQSTVRESDATGEFSGFTVRH
ncbi:MAG TPA: acylphosphatase [Phycisphaerae bacterium]|nr:acylphosphatase [Phycisphaerae bacterium]